MHVMQNWSNLEKRPPFLQFSSKFSESFFLVKDLTNCRFFLCSLAFGSILFLLGCCVWNMNDLFQRPLGPISIILNFSKKFGESRNHAPFIKKIEKFWWKFKDYKWYLHLLGLKFYWIHLKCSDFKQMKCWKVFVSVL